MSKPWQLSEKELYQEYTTSSQGITDEEAGARRKKAGPNEIPEKDRKDAFSILISQFNNPLIYILISATAIAFYLGDTIEASVILLIVSVNGILGFVQEYKSEKALQSLKKYISFTGVVTRAGVRKDIDARELVPGDMITVQIGDKIPADFRIISSEDFQTNESSLTGESMPVEKHKEPINLQDNKPQEISNMGFMGTVVTNGYATGIVTATGQDTFFGKTALTLSAKVPATSFERNINEFGNMLIKITLAMTVFVFVINALLGKNLLISFLFALALAVGITPEALPIVITIALSTSALELAKKKVIVKKLISIEDLGNMDIMCSDKTGTLGDVKISLEKAVGLDNANSEDLLADALLCSTLLGKKGKLRVKNPFDAAIYGLAYRQIEKKKFELLMGTVPFDIINFDFKRKRMSVVLRQGNEFLMITKGAAESVLQICSKKLQNGQETAMDKQAHEMHENYANQGYSVLALAIKKSKQSKDFTVEDEKDLTLTGFLLFSAPPKKTAQHTVKDLKNLGVELKILTGDGPLVTRKLCSDIAMEIKENRIILGSDLDQLEDKELEEYAERYNVFARVTPEQKYQIILALKRRKHTVAFMGDGINDAPSLRASDVGISVDNAVDVAKDAADIILLNKNLESVVTGVKIGRKVFGNIMKYILNTISANFGNMFTIALSSLFLKFIPLLPSQILLNNLISDIPLLTVSTDNVDKTFLRKPKKWDLGIISKFMIQFGFLSFVFDALIILSLIYWLQAPEDLFRTAWFLESVLSEIIITFAIRTQQPFYKSIPSMLLLITSVLATVFSVGIIYSPLASFFNFVPLSMNYLIAVGFVISLYFIAAEIAKNFFFKHNAI
ncbi:magnesium-translocating P-type ATPase [Candidatus Micrarchaeota archaeon]|nr:magnesium-translocating P-type ATPase [Candidatus Micrarchaeota archaeon]